MGALAQKLTELWAFLCLGASKNEYRGQCPKSHCDVCLSVCPSFLPSVTPFWQCSCHRIILKISGVITIDRLDVHVRGQGQRSRVNVTEVMTPFSRFRTVTPVLIHIWQWNDAQSLILLRNGTLFFFKVIRQISTEVTRLKKIVDFDPNWAFPDCNCSLN